MVMKCEDVWREISNYIEGDLDRKMSLAIEEHFVQCRNCKAILDGMRNVVQVYGDDRLFTVPASFYPRLHRRLADKIEGRKGSAVPWLVSLAATGLLAASVLLATVREGTVLPQRSVMSQPTRRLSQHLVAVVDAGKKYHVPGCEYMHGKYHMVPAEEAVREGYTPCVRCLGEALRRAANDATVFEGEQVAQDLSNKR
jgi:predicted anti-sigma-YlaC factor YlaD